MAGIELLVILACPLRNMNTCPLKVVPDDSRLTSSASNTLKFLHDSIKFAVFSAATSLSVCINVRGSGPNERIR